MYDGCEVIDADGHVMEPADLWDRYIDREFYGVRPRVGADVHDNGMVVAGNVMSRTGLLQPGEDYDIESYRRVAVGDWTERYRREWELGFPAPSYLEAMDAEGIDRMVLYPSRGLFAASVERLDGPLSGAICRAYNRWLADFCSTTAGRLIGVALGALHDPAVAVDEARYAVEQLGHRGIMVRPNPYAGRTLEDRAYDDFYAQVAALNVPLATHEGSGVRMPEYGDRHVSRLAQHAMCHPMEQMGAVYSFTAGGVMARHPDLRVAILEAGGGWLPYWLHRLDEHVEWLGEIPQEGGDLEMSPSDYFRRQGWINCEPDEPNLQGIVDYLGADRLLWASDFPHPDAKYPGAVESLFSKAQLSKEDLAAYAGANARALYQLPG
jgi:uncharacterized protein